MGTAKELVQGEPKTLVAIKMLIHARDTDDDDISNTGQDLDNFRAQMKLQYTNIASILAMCTDVKPHYIVYEYLDCVSVYVCVCVCVYVCVCVCVCVLHAYVHNTCMHIVWMYLYCMMIILLTLWCECVYY